MIPLISSSKSACLRLVDGGYLVWMGLEKRRACSAPPSMSQFHVSKDSRVDPLQGDKVLDPISPVQSV
jgi:hypothetical protein